MIYSFFLVFYFWSVCNSGHYVEFCETSLAHQMFYLGWLLVRVQPKHDERWSTQKGGLTRVLEQSTLGRVFLLKAAGHAVSEPSRGEEDTCRCGSQYGVLLPRWDKNGLPRGEEIQCSIGYKKSRRGRRTSE